MIIHSVSYECKYSEDSTIFPSHPFYVCTIHTSVGTFQGFAYLEERAYAQAIERIKDVMLASIESALLAYNKSRI